MCAQLCPTLVTPWTIAHQVPLSMVFSKQEYWNGLPFLFPGDLPNPGIKLMSLASPTLAGGFFITEPPGKPSWCYSKRFTDFLKVCYTCEV